MAFYLVTGGAGFIGSSIVRELVRRNERVRVLDNFSEGKRENLSGVLDKIELMEGDIRDASTLAKAVRGVDYVSHQAALRSVERSVKDPSETNDVNVKGTLNLLLECRAQKVKRVVYASSSSVYGDSDHLPTSEASPTHPISPYAISKLAAEHYCIAFTRLYGLETASLRYFNVFGPHQDPASEYAAVIPKFILKLLRNEPPTIDGDGQQSRDFSYIDDVVAANLKAATTPGIGGEVFNVAGGRGHSVLELYESINHILGKSIRPTFGPPRPGDVRHTLADLSKSRRLLNYPFETDFKKGLEKTVEWLRSLTKE
ncbi:MAG: SDR family oxidoreductase [Candidatus Omnitrophica bacterium]|nr:SDR family oxidoreductase [Candidatus Omnitrophota bacterium]